MALKTNLVSYWKMEEASGSRVDVHGSNDLTDNNTVLNATGISGNGADHERDTSEWLSIAHASQTNLDVTTGDFSISCWIKRESTGIFGGLVGKIDSGDVGGYRLVFNSDNKVGIFYC